MEEKMSQHYAILKRYLAQSLRDEKGNPKPNRARDKLLRLSPVQFQELSTDVYDELLRRQSAAAQQANHRGNGPGQVPPYLLPRENFHPKRNQARQKLATLPPPRFRDLATDVFYELERRFPMFPGRDISRVGSPATSVRGSPSRAVTPTGARPGYSPRNPSLGSQVMAGLGIPGVEGQSDGYGRPTAKTFQSNTIVPNKSTMVEDDDDDSSEVYGSRRDTNYTSRSVGGSEKDRKIAEFEAQVVDYENRVGELKTNVTELEQRLREKDSALGEIEESSNERQRVSSRRISNYCFVSTLIIVNQANELERERWSDLQSELENKVIEARNLNNNLQSELDKVRGDHAHTERELRSQVDLLAEQANSGVNEWRSRYEDLDETHQELRTQLERQEKVTNEVKLETVGFFNQMKTLSERSDQSLEREERLVQQIQSMENEIKEWKTRYARTKSQIGILRASSTAVSMQPKEMDEIAKSDAFTASDGLVRHEDVTRFQIAIDELLRSARSSEPNAVLAHVKAVVIAVRSITLSTGDTQSINNEQAQQQYQLKTKVSATANNLITAARNFSMSHGLSPISLLDAAASHLSSSIIELIKVVKVHTTPADDLEDDDDDDYYGLNHTHGSAGGDSNNSSLSSPPPSLPPDKAPQPLRTGTPNGIPDSKLPPTNNARPRDSRIDELKVPSFSPLPRLRTGKTPSNPKTNPIQKTRSS